MKKWFKRIAIGMISALILIAITLRIANSNDENLKPEVENVLKRPDVLTDRGLRAFHYLNGLRMGIAPDKAEEAGAELWHQIENLDADAQDAVLKEKLPTRRELWPSYMVPSIPKGMAWSDAWEKGEPRLREYYEKAKGSLPAYIKLIEYGEITPAGKNRPLSALSMPIQSILTGHKALTVYLAKLASEKKWSEIERLIQQENKFQRSQIPASSLLTVAVAHVVLHNNVDFLDLENKKSPRRFQRATLDSFELPPSEQIEKGTFEEELRSFANILPMLRTFKIKDIFFDSPVNMKMQMAANYLFLPNQSTNKYFELIEESRTQTCPPREDEADDLYCLPADQWAHPQWPWQWLRNPVGKSLIRIFSFNSQMRIKKLRQKQQDIARIRASLKSA